MVYDIFLLKLIEPEIVKYFWKNQNDFRRNRSTTLQILAIRQIIGSKIISKHDNCSSKHLILYKLEQIIIANGLSKETVTVMMMLYRNTKAKLHSPDGVLQGDTLAPYLLTLCRDYVLQTSINLIKTTVSYFKKVEADDITLNLWQTHYADYLGHLANIPTQAEFLLHSLEQAEGGLHLYKNVKITEHMCLN